METLEGHAAEDFHDLRMEVGDTVHRARLGDTLGLELADGRVIPLELAEATFVPNTDETGSFDDLFERELAEPFLEWAPGEDIPVRVRGFYVRVGEAIAVRGIAEQRATPGDGYRVTGTQVEAIEVEAIAAGPDAVAQLGVARPMEPASRRQPAAVAPVAPVADKRAPSVTAPLAQIGVGLLLALAGAALVAVDGALVGRGAGLLLPGLLAVVSGIVFLRRRRFLPDLRSPSEDLSGMGKRTQLGLRVATMLFVSFLGAGVLAGLVLTDFPNPALFVFGLGVLVALAAAGLAVSLVIRERRSFRRLRQLSSAPGRLEENRWAALDGRVTSGRYARVRSHEAERETYEDTQGRSSTRVWFHFRDRVNAEALQLELTSGETVEVQLGGAQIAGTRITEDGEVLTETIEPGDAIRVVGRPSRTGEGWSVSGTGEGALLVLGGPGASAGGAVAMHLLALAALGGIALVAGALAALAIA